jgi:hypothetical protein
MQGGKFLIALFMSLFIFCGLTAEVWAVPTIEFSSSSWSLYFDGVDKVLTIADAWIWAVNGGGTDPLYDRGEIIMPGMTVGGNPTDGWTLSGGTIKIIDWEFPATEYMVGTLGIGDLIPDVNYATAYTSFQTDIVVTDVDNSIGSDALDEIDTFGKLDFYLNLIGYAAEPDQPDFETALKKMKKDTTYKWYAKKKSPTGSMTVIPVPGALVLSSIGLVFGSAGANLTRWLVKRKRR